MDVNDAFRPLRMDAESNKVRNLRAKADLYEKKYKRTIKLCKCIWENCDYIDLNKGELTADNTIGASELWHELE